MCCQYNSRVRIFICEINRLVSKKDMRVVAIWADKQYQKGVPSKACCVWHVISDILVVSLQKVRHSSNEVSFGCQFKNDDNDTWQNILGGESNHLEHKSLETQDFPQNIFAIRWPLFVPRNCAMLTVSSAPAGSFIRLVTSFVFTMTMNQKDTKIDLSELGAKPGPAAARGTL